MESILPEAALPSSGSRLSSLVSFMSSSAASFSPSSALKSRDVPTSGAADQRHGQGIVAFLTAIGFALAIFAVQFCLFLLLRNKLARIFKPKTYLVPERERTESPPPDILAMIKKLVNFSDREIINKCGLDAYFFLRYLKTLCVIFIPICAVVLPILIPINFINGEGHQVDFKNDTSSDSSSSVPTGLDTLAWGNVGRSHTSRYAAHLVMAILVVIWVCGVFFFEMKAYIKVRQDYLTSAEHRLRASATTVLVNSIPAKWLTEEALHGLFDVFPGGVRNVWLNRDLGKLLDKISLRDGIHSKLESAETQLIKDAKKAQLKQEKAEKKKQRKKDHLKSLSKEERAALDAVKDAEAQEIAHSNQGISAGGHENVPHSVEGAVLESAAEIADHTRQNPHARNEDEGARPKKNRLAAMMNPLSKVEGGIRSAATKADRGVNSTLQTSNGLVLNAGAAGQPTSSFNEASQIQREDTHSPETADNLELQRTVSNPGTVGSTSSTRAIRNGDKLVANGNTTRKLKDGQDTYAMDNAKFWQFWKPPPGGYASPVPQGLPAEDSTEKPKENKTGWQRFKSCIPFVGDDEEETYEYPAAFNSDYEEELAEKAEWEKYLKKKHRPTHHLPLFGASWMFGVPWVTKKVDTIYWCREELARLNVEIEEDQKHPERFPVLTSAFVQFNHQIAAHMACQSLTHHVPRQMAPRNSEINPRDVIWGNMAVTWWQGWVRTVAVVLIVAVMTVFWAVPVAWTAALGQLDKLIDNADFLSYLKEHKAVGSLVKAISGVLPAALLGLLLALLPLILDLLAGLKGAKTAAQKSEFVQICYFTFLFIQVFLVVSIASFAVASFGDLFNNLKELGSVNKTLKLLAENLPAAANYFFSYMVLQALSTSSGTLLQIGSLIMWFIIGPMMDSTARDKWSRNTKLNQIKWGSFFPVYTNFACIALVYCVIAPLISIFAIITFSLLWVAHRYAMVYVIRFESDTGGVLYPRAINQTFTGLYVMELCLAGLFYIVKDANGKLTCITHGTIMIVVFVLTILYQIGLNMSFSPLFRYLPITFEDEAVLRDEAFQRAQDRRMGLVHDVSEDEDEDSTSIQEEKPPPFSDDQDIELQKIPSTSGRKPLNPAQHVGSWAIGGGRQVGAWARGGGNQLLKLKKMADNPKAAEYRRQQRQKDLESQRAIGDALFGDIHDEIEDLTPNERDLLTKHAFQHYALRARRPTVWIPRDDLGISDDEIRRTKAYSDSVWISNEGTALDSKLRVVYGKNPPDFSEMDVINL